MDKLLSIAAQALGKKSAEKRHKKLKELGVDISEFYSQMRKKGLNKPKKISKEVLTNVR